MEAGLGEELEEDIGDGGRGKVTTRIYRFNKNAVTFW